MNENENVANEAVQEITTKVRSGKGWKVAIIGAAAAGIGYAIYRLTKARKDKKAQQEQETAENPEA